MASRPDLDTSSTSTQAGDDTVLHHSDSDGQPVHDLGQSFIHRTPTDRPFPVVDAYFSALQEQPPPPLRRSERAPKPSLKLLESRGTRAVRAAPYPKTRPVDDLNMPPPQTSAPEDDDFRAALAGAGAKTVTAETISAAAAAFLGTATDDQMQLLAAATRTTRSKKSKFTPAELLSAQRAIFAALPAQFQALAPRTSSPTHSSDPKAAAEAVLDKVVDLVARFELAADDVNAGVEDDPATLLNDCVTEYNQLDVSFSRHLPLLRSDQATYSDLASRRKQLGLRVDAVADELNHAVLRTRLSSAAAAASAPPPAQPAPPPHLPSAPARTAAGGAGGGRPQRAAISAASAFNAPTNNPNLLPLGPRGGSSAPSSRLGAPGATAFSSAPTATSTAHQPNSYARYINLAMYAALPPPWNEPPDPHSPLPPYNFMKDMHTGALQKFSGFHDDYEYWRTHMIHNVHLQLVHIGLKIQAFIYCLRDAVPDVVAILQTMGTHPEDGYVEVITHLEDKYGGTARITYMKLAALRALPPARRGSSDDLNRVVRHLEAYRICLNSNNQLDRFNHEAVFHDVLDKFEPDDQQDFWLWAARHAQTNEPDTDALLLWLKGQRTALSRVAERTSIRTRLGSLPSTFPDHTPFRTRLPSAPPGPSLYPPSTAAAPSHIDQHTFVTREYKQRGTCQYCKGPSHKFLLCTAFMALSPLERKKFIQSVNRCFNCLGRHHSRSCPKDKRCPICSAAHHAVLHVDEPSDKSAKRVHFTAETLDDTQADISISVDETQADDSDSAATMHTFHAAAVDPTKPVRGEAAAPAGVSLRTIAVRVSNLATGHCATANVLLDDGSDTTVISTSLANRLRLATTVTDGAKLRIVGFGGQTTEHAALYGKVKISSLVNAASKVVTATVIPAPAGNLRPIDWSRLKAEHPALEDLDIPSPVDGPVEMIVGMNCKDLHRSIKEIHTPGPDARLTRLGWTVVGPTTPSREPVQQPTVLFGRLQRIRESVASQVQSLSHTIRSSGAPDGRTVQLGDDRSLTDLLLKSWQLDRGSPAPKHPPHHQVLLERMAKSTSLADGAFTSAILWKPGEPAYRSNRGPAIGRLDQLLRTKLSTANLRQAYGALFNNWHSDGIVRLVDDVHAQECHYLPHFPVFKASNPSKIRPVFDAAAAFGPDKKSLNAGIYSGPNLMNDLPEVLLRFRAHQVALTGDIKDMFLRVRLPEHDMKYHRFVWRDDAGSVVDYEFTRLVFGVTCSPALAIFAISQLADTHKITHPLAADAVRLSSIVDDITTSLPDEARALQLVRELGDLFAKAGMEIKKWGSSHDAVLKDIPLDDRAKTVHMSTLGGLDQTAGVMTLGMHWLPATDELTFTIDLPTRTTWTPRDVLGFFLRIFDPHGLVSPYILQARKIFQEIWVRHRDWNHKLDDNDLEPWRVWLAHVKDLPLLRFPRCAIDANNGEAPLKRELHLFSDASEVGLGAAVYLSSFYESGAITTRLVLGKSRVSPVEFKSIPRLELAAALMTVKLAHTATAALELDLADAHFWTDSLVVLTWIHTMTRVLKTAVANMVQAIHDDTDPNQWHHVPTELNPADLASRGRTPKQLQESTLWASGPAFLKQDPVNWPAQPKLGSTEDALAEVRKHQESNLLVMLVGQTRARPLADEYTEPTYHPHPSSFSSYRRVINIVMRALVWIFRESKLVRTPEFFLRAEVHYFRWAQVEGLQRTRHHLETQGRVDDKSWLSRHNPVLDDDGLVRVQARLSTAIFLSPDSRCPIVLPKQHPIITLIMTHLHKHELKHAGGHKQLLAQFQARFHTLGAADMARSVTSSCVPCKRVHAKRHKDPFAPLPDDRVMPNTVRVAPFDTTGVDGIGPLWIRSASGKEKRYVIIFTCAFYRAVHLEVVPSLSTEAFLLSFQRFVARNPRPSKMRSDNGGNFVKADVELTKLWGQLDSDLCVQKYPNIAWEFNPPKCPQRGGFYERLVQSFKRALYANCAAGDLNLDEFTTLVTVCEGMLNNRPIGLTPSPNPADPLPLTPSRFKTGADYMDLATLPENAERSLSIRFAHTNRALDCVWRRLIHELLPHYHALNKGAKPRRGLEVGDVVIYLEAKDRGRWPLARVHAVEQSERDGAVRTVVVKYKGALYRRAVGSLLLLEAATQQHHS